MSSNEDFDLPTGPVEETVEDAWNDDTDWDAVAEEWADEIGAEIDGVEILPTVAIVGRPNVGKSTLVNRIIGRREAVVEDVPGVTRDRVSYEALWNGRTFMVQDTGGWEQDAKGMHRSIAQQAEIAMGTADLIVLVCDGNVGITSADETVAKSLRRSDTPVILAVNKVDSEKAELQSAEFWGLGLDQPYAISAAHGRGTADLLDEILRRLPSKARMRETTDVPRRVALVGKPNVGKSSLLNKLTGEERSVVDNVAGTTVDPVDSLVELGGKTWRFVDTAGLRRKVNQAYGHEYYASLRTRGAIEAAEVVVLLLDASEPITEQDLRVISMVADAGRALVIAFNKWDLVDEDRRYDLDKEIDRELSKILTWAYRVNISATTGRALAKLVPAMEGALDSWDKRIPTGPLNTWMSEVVAATPPPMRGGKLPRIRFCTQATTRPPTFVFFSTGFLEAGYRRFLERRLRETFGFDGSPVRVNVRVKERRQRK
ncbi:MAG: ribosome biogenesis GTPase Der [Dietzia sp.]|uniref:GTPase Der n=1 Tax=Dietzia natronolimnaea TaxID=161920 RepID=A0A2A2WL01_9ACTN|nr:MULTISPECIES: ribosome biogenesis GTPase Der [Dietzia]MBB1032862.1 ribosome biogenesis GTPase Der [Dietzia sp. CQ4]MBB1042766.1 ribosome biogenesis GTPase Der [Dietzia sp. Cai40]MBB1043195.1 ribosome biogenesis GTPase Der [Dietzia sp. DQ11-44]MBB1053829.1 ribosome biogenesis GTPase Der [Dietzia sp. B44]MBB1055940.1 ribosome biogenesis GTPase Der [Dietzia sp. B19]